MVKKFIGIIFMVCISLMAFTQIDYEELERAWIIKNKIKQKDQNDYSYVAGKPGSRGNKTSSTFYDNNGRVIEVIHYNRDGSIMNLSTYNYDTDGNRTEYIRYRGDRNEMTFRQNYLYDTNGNKLVETGFNGIDNFRNTYKYFSDGRLMEINYFVGGSLDETRVFSYSQNLTEVAVMDPSGNVSFWLHNRHDEDGKLIEELKFENDNSVSRKTNYQYNPDGKIVKEEKHAYGRLTERVSYIYDGSGRIVEIYEEAPGKEKYLKNKYTYDRGGSLLEEKWRPNATSDFSYKNYSYDRSGKLSTVDCYYASYKYQVLYKFNYKYQ